MSDAAQGPGWWQAADGKWYPPDQPPAPGWWRASDGNWYPPDAAGAGDSPAEGSTAPSTTETTPGSSPTDPSSPEVSLEASAPAPAGPDATAPVAETPAPTPASAPAPGPETALVGAAPPGEPGVAPAPMPTGGAPRSSKRGLVVVAVVAVLVLVAGVAFVATRRGDDTQVAAEDTTATTAATADGGDGSGGDGSGDSGSGDESTTEISDEMPSEDITLDPDVVIVNSERGEKFKGYSNDGTALLLDPSAENADQLAPGKVLLLTGITVVGVAAVDTTDDGLVVTGQPVTLPEVIADGELSWEDRPIDPEQMRLFSYEDDGSTVEDDGSGGGSSGGSSGDGGTTDDSEITEEEILEEGGGGIVDGLGGNGFTGATKADRSVGVRALPATEASPATIDAASKTVNGSFDDYDFALTHEPQNGGHHVVLNVKMKGDMAGTINADVNINPMITSGSSAVSNSTVDKFNFSIDDWSGDATVDVELQSTNQLASKFNPTRIKVPIGIEFPFPIYGIPFTLSLTGSVQVQLSFATANSTLGGQAKITFGGDAGFVFKDGALLVAGNRIQDAPDLLNTVKAMAGGPVGVVFTTELPKVGLGFGFLQTGANVYISQGMVVSQTVLPSPVSCTSTGIAYVMAVGLEGKFLGYEKELGRKPVVDKRWDYTLPKTARCTAE
jgi:hypothetical protein